MSIDYTIGDDIAAIENHPQGAFKKGDVFTCKSLITRDCCNSVQVDIGVKIERGFECGCGNRVEGTVWWFYASRFRKLDNLVQIN